MAYQLITQAQLEARVGARDLARALDENNDGAPDPVAVTELCKSASSTVLVYLGATMDLSAIAQAASEETAYAVVNLTLDVATAMLSRRAPMVVRLEGGWIEAMKLAQGSLKLLREAFTKLDTPGPPNPAANSGGTVYSGAEGEVSSSATTGSYNFAINGFGHF